MLTDFFQNPILLIVYFISLLFAIAVHEFSHAIIADYLGDPTARSYGRISLNPLKHIDTYGIIFLLVFGFGWGKPVPFDPYNLKNPRRDSAFISFAGPLSNIVTAILCSILIKLLILFKLSILTTIGIPILQIFININIILAIFNLLPIAPLDGFKIVEGLLNEEQAYKWKELERYGIIFLLFLILPIGGKSMLDGIITPIIRFFTSLLI